MRVCIKCQKLKICRYDYRELKGVSGKCCQVCYLKQDPDYYNKQREAKKIQRANHPEDESKRVNKWYWSSPDSPLVILHREFKIKASFKDFKKWAYDHDYKMMWNYYYLMDGAVAFRPELDFKKGVPHTIDNLKWKNKSIDQLPYEDSLNRKIVILRSQKQVSPKQ